MSLFPVQMPPPCQATYTGSPPARMRRCTATATAKVQRRSRRTVYPHYEELVRRGMTVRGQHKLARVHLHMCYIRWGTAWAVLVVRGRGVMVYKGVDGQQTQGRGVSEV